MSLDILKEIGPYLAAVLLIGGLGWKASRIFLRYEQKLEQIITSSNNNTNLIGALTGMLADNKVISSGDLIKINGVLVSSLQIQPLNPNPISPEELARLNGYIQKAEHELLTQAELVDFKALLLVLKAEKPNDVLVNKLINYSAFISGTYGQST